jgi:hypothetical protein
LFYASKDSLSRNTLFSRKLSFSFINNKLPYFDDFSNLLSLQYANYKNDLFNINQFIQSLILNGFTVIDYQEDNNFDDYTLSYYCKIYNLDKNIYYEFFLSLNKKAEYINNFNVLDSNNNKIKSYNNLDLKKFDFSKLDLETEVLEITKEKLFVDSDIEFEIKNKLKLGGVF